MEAMYYIGLDVHKRKISYCAKDSGGEVYAEGSLPATRFGPDRWMKTLPQPWSAAMEAGYPAFCFLARGSWRARVFFPISHPQKQKGRAPVPGL
jgi:hypothetical protein